MWGPDYVTAPEMKSYLRIDDDADDTFIALWVSAVSRNIDDFCGRQFGQVEEVVTNVYETTWDKTLGRYVAEIDDLPSVEGLVVTDANALPVTGYVLSPTRNTVRGKPFERITVTRPGPLTIATDQWGWSAVPPSVKVGMFLQGARLAARRDSPFGIAGSPSDGSEMRLLAQLDPDFRTVLKPLQRIWYAA
jgi:hypothetical protein